MWWMRNSAPANKLLCGGKLFNSISFSVCISFKWNWMWTESNRHINEWISHTSHVSCSLCPSLSIDRPPNAWRQTMECVNVCTRAGSNVRLMLTFLIIWITCNTNESNGIALLVHVAVIVTDIDVISNSIWSFHYI